MNQPAPSQGFGLLCDEYGTLLEILPGSAGMVGLVPGGKLLDVVGQRNHFKLLDFLAALRSEGIVFDWEFSLRLPDREELLHLSGVRRQADLILIGHLVPAETLDLIKELMLMTNQQTNELRMALKDKQVAARETTAPDAKLFQEMVQINSELAKVQRELAKKNIELERLNEQVKALADTDPLTGLKNRRGFFEVAGQQWKHARRYERPLAAAMFDIDHFKKINDTYGHAVGDLVLKETASRAAAIFRESDIIGRYGGEEFCILLPETTQANALEAAEKLRLRIASEPVDTESGPVSVTISIGVAGALPEDASLEGLFKNADAALYHAKRTGRNRTSVFHPDS